MASGTLEVTQHTAFPKQALQPHTEKPMGSSERRRQHRFRRHCKASLLPLTAAHLILSRSNHEARQPTRRVASAKLSSCSHPFILTGPVTLACPASALEAAGGSGSGVQCAQSPQRLRSLGPREGLQAVKEAGDCPEPHGPKAQVPTPGGVLPSPRKLLGQRRKEKQAHATPHQPVPSKPSQNLITQSLKQLSIQTSVRASPKHTHRRTRANEHTHTHTHVQFSGLYFPRWLLSIYTWICKPRGLWIILSFYLLFTCKGKELTAR